MATSLFSSRKFFSLAIGLQVALVALLLPYAHVQPIPVHSNEELAKMVFLRGGEVSEVVNARLGQRGFSKANVKRLQKCTLLCGKSVETRFESRVLWFLNQNQSQAQVTQAIATCSRPLLGGKFESHLNRTVHWLSDVGLTKDQVVHAMTACPSAICVSAMLYIEPIVLSLLDVGLSTRQVVRAISCCPDILDASVEEHSETVQWLLDLGLNKDQTVLTIARCPELLCPGIQSNATVQWLLDFGLMQGQVAKLIRVIPRILEPDARQTLKARMQKLLDFGMSRFQVRKAILRFHELLRSSIERNLDANLEWLVELYRFDQTSSREGYCHLSTNFGL